MRTFRIFSRNAILGLIAATSGARATAAVYTPLSVEFSGGVAPASSTTPWVTGTFETEGAGTVLFTLAAANLTNPERVTSFYFNFDDSLNVQNLSFQLVSSGGFTLPTINKGKNAFKADGDGRFDVRLDFAVVQNLAQAFGQGDTLTYRLSYSGAIDASKFGYLSAPSGPNGPFFAAALIQDTPGALSGWIGATEFALVPVPEASSLLAVGVLLGTAMVVGVRRRERLDVSRV